MVRCDGVGSACQFPEWGGGDWWVRGGRKRAAALARARHVATGGGESGEAVRGVNFFIF